MSQSQRPSFDPRTASSNCSRLLRRSVAELACLPMLRTIIQKKADEAAHEREQKQSEQRGRTEIARSGLVDPLLEQRALDGHHLQKDRAGFAGRVLANLGSDLGSGLAGTQKAAGVDDRPHRGKLGLGGLRQAVDLLDLGRLIGQQASESLQLRDKSLEDLFKMEQEALIPGDQIAALLVLGVTQQRPRFLELGQNLVAVGHPVAILDHPGCGPERQDGRRRQG